MRFHENKQCLVIDQHNLIFSPLSAAVSILGGEGREESRWQMNYSSNLPPHPGGENKPLHFLLGKLALLEGA